MFNNIARKSLSLAIAFSLCSSCYYVFAEEPQENQAAQAAVYETELEQVADYKGNEDEGAKATEKSQTANQNEDAASVIVDLFAELFFNGNDTEAAMALNFLNGHGEQPDFLVAED